MRTTLTIEDDLAEALKELARERRHSFKETVNETIRAGLNASRGVADEYELPTFSLGVRPGVDLTKAFALAAALDDEETIRQLELGK